MTSVAVSKLMFLFTGAQASTSNYLNSETTVKNTKPDNAVDKLKGLVSELCSVKLPTVSPSPSVASICTNGLNANGLEKEVPSKSDVFE